MSLPRFTPPAGLRSSFIQSVLASKRPAQRIWRRHGVELEAHSTRHLLAVRDEAGDAVQLVGFHTPGRDGGALVVMIHGWEGCHQSSYLYASACQLHRDGHALFRLNLRDHGDSHALNRAPFHSARLHEVLDAIHAAQALEPQRPLVVVGWSLGGNFALRVGLQGPANGLHPARCIAVSPSINPGATLQALDAGPRLIHRYFTRKWQKTLHAKAAAWPGVHDFSRQHALKSFVEITRTFVEDFTPFPTLASYLAQYTLTPDVLSASPTPIAILTAEDDSVIPVADFDGLLTGGSIASYHRVTHGGHCGFIENYRLDGWGERWVAAQVKAALAP